jgi:DNA-binding beta-propeller fold protein YncE
MRYGLLFVLLCGCRASPPDGVARVELPDGRPGIGFDDLRFSPTHGVMAPGARTGELDLVDVTTRKVTAISGFAVDPLWFGGHGQGPTSVDEGDGFLFATDRTTEKISVIDPETRRILSTAHLGANPDYARFVSATSEVWVTEPDAQQIEVFTLSGRSLARSGTISVLGGPESLVIDPMRDRAYTHLWGGATISIDVHSRAGLATWGNGCVGSRGIALDAARGFLFAGCDEGRGTVLDVANGGAMLGNLQVSSTGVDVIDYSPSLMHLYLPGKDSGTMTIAEVSSSGSLTLRSTVTTVGGAHCVAADDRGNAWVCDQDNGELLIYPDTP